MATKVWAHRGASGYAPENTMAAFKLAAEMGADGIELDVHESADGKLMVIHDETVDRTTNGKGQVVDYTCADLKKLDASNGFAEFANARIPTLREVYGYIRNTPLTVNVEIKCDINIYWGIWDKVLQVEREMGMTGRVLYSSFNHYVLMELKKSDPNAQIGLLYANGMVDPWLYAEHLGAQALHPQFLAPLRAPGMIDGCRGAGIDINAWTVNDEAVMKQLADSQINAIITNYPDVALKALGR